MCQVNQHNYFGMDGVTLTNRITTAGSMTNTEKEDIQIISKIFDKHEQIPCRELGISATCQYKDLSSLVSPSSMELDTLGIPQMKGLKSRITWL